MTERPADRKKRWERETLEPSRSKAEERAKSFTTVSMEPVDVLYTEADVAGIDAERELGFPGEPPYTRGVHPTLYRSKLWTMRQFVGFGSARDTNARNRYLLAEGQSGLSVAFHLPNLMGIDSDDPRARGEVGKCGVAIDSLEDMETLFEGIPLDRVSVSMTTNAPAAIMLSMLVAVADSQGVPRDRLSGTIQNDILKEYIAQKTYIFPPRPSMRLIVDTFRFCTDELKRFNMISISGYHIREAGSTAVQELAFTLRDGIEYVEWAVKAGLDVDEFGPRLSFFFNAHNDLFEEVAKYRAARRIWYRVMKERFHARTERACWMRFHTQTAGCSLTAQQPMNNVVRTTLQALAAVLGGTQSLHTNSLDEAVALPTEEAVTLALRTQQIIAHESGVANTVDPLGGSYFVEALTRKMEEGCLAYFDRIDALGGMIPAIEAGFPQREIADASYRYQKAIERKEKIVVGVNEFVAREEKPFSILTIDDHMEREQVERLRALRGRRDDARVQAALAKLTATARTEENLLPHVLDAVKAYATLGEMIASLRSVFGSYEEPATY